MDTEQILNSRDALPPELVEHVTVICGEKGEEWLDRLPRVIAELEELWAIRVEKAFPGIEYNFVAPAMRADGTEAVVKIAPPFKETEIFSEAKWLREHSGVGAARFYVEDRERHAILIERVRPGRSLWDEFAGEPAGCVAPAIDLLKTTLRKPASDLSDTLSLDRWFDNFRSYPESGFPADYAQRALEIYDRLSTQTGRIFYLHGDYHHGNVITSDERGPFIAIDAKGLIGHVGYEIAVFLNNQLRWQRHNSDLVEIVNDGVARFSAAFEVSQTEIREWAFAAMIIGEWWSIEDGREPDAAKLAFSDIWGI